MIAGSDALALDGRPVIEVVDVTLRAGELVLEGTASAFEATLIVEIGAETEMRRFHVSATLGAPERGTWAAIVPLSPQDRSVTIFDSAVEVVEGGRLAGHKVTLDLEDH